jgi:hypothetical protein
MEDLKADLQALRRLEDSYLPEEQLRLREGFERSPAYYAAIRAAYLRNPFLRLTEDEAAVLAKTEPEALGHLIAARDAATRSKTLKIVVFCMPKSGSSYVQSALQHALQLPFVSLTSFGALRQSSNFGMNAREQELDAMALARAVLISPQGFVAQHHTRYTPYLALQMRLFGLTPIVTLRNVFDALVSFDDMMMAWRRSRPTDPWISDAQFALPANFVDLAPAERYQILAPSFGVWLINFYLSWKRGFGQRLVKPLVLRYEDHVLAPERLVERLTAFIEMRDEQKARLQAFARQPDRTKARFNVGRSGRGREQVPEATRRFLADYAGAFRSELTDEDLDYLIGEPGAGGA